MYHIVGSTGRTGTNFIAGTLNKLESVLALHEGSEVKGRESIEILPPINLENFAVYKRPEKSKNIILEKRSHETIEQTKQSNDVNTLIDIAYYNVTIADAILHHHKTSKMIGIIRNGYDFVRSAAFVEGEDILAVGWPDPKKELTSREAFIAMGRLRPLKGTKEYDEWNEWGTIERNIWLWRETNNLLFDVQAKYPKRVNLITFESLKTNPNAFWKSILATFDIPFDSQVLRNLSTSQARKNRKSTGYQINAISTWTKTQRELMEAAQQYIDLKWTKNDG